MMVFNKAFFLKISCPQFYDCNESFNNLQDYIKG